MPEGTALGVQNDIAHLSFALVTTGSVLKVATRCGDAQPRESVVHRREHLRSVYSRLCAHGRDDLLCALLIGC